MTNGISNITSLRKLNPRVISQSYRKLRYHEGAFVPTETDLPFDAASVYNVEFQENGSASFLTEFSKSMPLADANANLIEYPVHLIVAGYSESWLRSRMQAGNRDVRYSQYIAKLQMAAGRAIAELSNKYVAYGESKLSVTGIVNNPNVAVENLPDVLYAMNSQELFEFFVDIKFRNRTDSNYTFESTCLEVSPTIHNLLCKSRSEDNEKSVKTRLLESNSPNDDPIYDTIGESPELLFDRLEANGVLAPATNKDRIIIMDKSIDVCSRQVERQQIKMIPSEWMNSPNLTKQFGLFMAQTPVQVHQPLGIRYINTPKAV